MVNPKNFFFFCRSQNGFRLFSGEKVCSGNGFKLFSGEKMCAGNEQ